MEEQIEDTDIPTSENVHFTSAMTSQPASSGEAWQRLATARKKVDPTLPPFMFHSWLAGVAGQRLIRDLERDPPWATE